MKIPEIEARIGVINAMLSDFGKKLREQQWATSGFKAEVETLEAEYELMEGEKLAVKAHDMVELDLWKRIQEVMGQHSDVVKMRRFDLAASRGAEDRIRQAIESITKERAVLRELLAKTGDNVLWLPEVNGG